MESFKGFSSLLQPSVSWYCCADETKYQNRQIFLIYQLHIYKINFFISTCLFSHGSIPGTYRNKMQTYNYTLTPEIDTRLHRYKSHTHILILTHIHLIPNSDSFVFSFIYILIIFLSTQSPWKTRRQKKRQAKHTTKITINCPYLPQPQENTRHCVVQLLPSQSL